MHRILLFLHLVCVAPAMFAQNPASLTLRSTSLTERSSIGDLQICIAGIGQVEPGTYTLKVYVPDDQEISTNIKIDGAKEVTVRIPVLDRETVVMARLLKNGNPVAE